MTKIEITCNKCGKAFNIWDIQEMFSIHKNLGYGTRYDGDRLEIDLCCDCMNDLIEQCVVSPIIETTHTYDNQTTERNINESI